MKTLAIVERTLNILEHDYDIADLEGIGVPTCKEIAERLDDEMRKTTGTATAPLWAEFTAAAHALLDSGEADYAIVHQAVEAVEDWYEIQEAKRSAVA